MTLSLTERACAAPPADAHGLLQAAEVFAVFLIDAAQRDNDPARAASARGAWEVLSRASQIRGRELTVVWPQVCVQLQLLEEIHAGLPQDDLELRHGREVYLEDANEALATRWWLTAAIVAGGAVAATMLVLALRPQRRALGEAVGLCFPYANQLARDLGPGAYVMHGQVREPGSNKVIDHAWVEHKGKVYDWQTMTQGKGKPVPVKTWKRLWRPTDTTWYTADEAIVNMLRHGHHGPWT